MANFEREDEEQAAESHKPFCPKCGSTDIRASQTHRTLDNLLRSFSLRPHRCRSCRKRFYMRKPADQQESDARQVEEAKEVEEVKESPPRP